MRLFKKKQKPTYDFTKYKIKLNFKTISFYETWTDKPFMSIQSEEDVLKLLYASLVCNNDITISYEGFKVLLADEHIANWLMSEYGKLLKFDSQFGKENDGEVQPFKLSDIVGSLIIRGLNPEYVMYDMGLWELPIYSNAIENKAKEDIENQRFWTFMNIMPHLDHKKVKKPEDILPLPWEKDSKLEELNKNTKTALNFLKKNG